MKVSISLPDEDVDFLDAYAREQGVPSRSAVLQRAIGLLRHSGLGAAYGDAWAQWQESDEAELWEVAAADGLAADGLVADGPAIDGLPANRSAS